MPEKVIVLGTAPPARQWHCHVYVHDDVTWHTDIIVRDRLRWWLDEMAPLLPPDTGLRLNIWRKVEGITDKAYVSTMADGERIATELSHAIADATIRETCPMEKHGYHLLLTQYAPNPQEQGYALPQLRMAVASIVERRTATHELSHLFDARHEDGRVAYVGRWPCDTVMHPRTQRRRHCDRFSVENQANIRRFLAQDASRFPEPTRPQPAAREDPPGLLIAEVF